MKTDSSKTSNYSIGIWIAIVALCLTFTAWIMQAYSLLNWEEAIKLGLQNSSFTGDALEQAMANKERGEAIADIIWVMPLNLLAFLGIIRKRLFGFIAAMMVFSICIYFPLFYIFQIWSSHPDTVIAAICLWAIPSTLGIAGLWNNRKQFYI